MFLQPQLLFCLIIKFANILLPIVQVHTNYVLNIGEKNTKTLVAKLQRTLFNNKIKTVLNFN